MRLYLVRHGEALDANEDPKRPLSPYGQSKIEAAAHFLGKKELSIQQVFHSGKARAEQTAIILAKQVTQNVSPLLQEGLHPNDSTREMLQMIQTLKGDTMLVGHLPYMAELASRLVTQEPAGAFFQFQPGNILCLEKVNHTWSVVWFLDSSLCLG